MNKCSKCNQDLISCIDLELNGQHICPNCLITHIFKNEDDLLAVNTLKDNDYEYTLPKKEMIRFIKCNLTRKQFKNLIQKYPKSFYLHDDFYDENGKALQPKG